MCQNIAKLAVSLTPRRMRARFSAPESTRKLSTANATLTPINSMNAKSAAEN